MKPSGSDNRLDQIRAASNVGIAVGTAGNDIALEAADVALMSSDLRTVPYLVRLGRKVAWRLRASVAVALGVKFALIGFGALGWVPLWVAILGDDGLTLALVAFALPLLGFKRPTSVPGRPHPPSMSAKGPPPLEV